MATQAEINAQQQRLVEIRDDIRASRAAGTLSDVQFRRLGQKLLDRNRLVSEMVPTDATPSDTDFRPLSQTPTGGGQLGAAIGTPDLVPEERFLTERLPPSGPLRSRISQELGQFQTGVDLPESRLAPGIGDRLLRGLEQIGLGTAARTVLVELAQAPNLEDVADPAAITELTEAIERAQSDPSQALPLALRTDLDPAEELSQLGAFARIFAPGAINLVDQAIASVTRFAFPKTTAGLPRLPIEVREGEEGLEADPEREARAEQQQLIAELGLAPLIPSPAIEALRGARAVARGTRAARPALVTRGLRIEALPVEPPKGTIVILDELPDPLRILTQEPVRVSPPTGVVGARPPALRARRRVAPIIDPGELPAQTITVPGPFRTVNSYVPNPTEKGATKLSNAAINAAYQPEKQIIRETRAAAEAALGPGPGKSQKAAQIADEVVAHSTADREILKSLVAPPPGGKGPGRLSELARMASSKADDMVATAEKYVRQEISPEALRLFDAGTDNAGSQVITRVISAENQLRRNLTEMWFAGRAIPEGRARGIFGVLKALNDAEATNVFDVVTRGAKPISNTADEAARAIRFWNEDVISEAINVEVLSEAASGAKSVVRRRENFMPHLLTNEVKRSGRLSGQLARDIARANPGVNMRQAENIVDQIRNGERFGKSGSLNFRREVNVPDKWLEKDVRKLMPRYYTGAYREIAEARWYGNDFQDMGDIINRVDEAFLREAVPEASRAGFGRADFEKLTRRMALQTGEGFTPGRQKISRAIRGFTVVTSMHRSALSTLADFHKLPIISRGLGMRGQVADTVGGIVDSWKEGTVLRSIRKGRTGAQEFHEVASIRAGISPTGGLVDRYHSDIIRFATEQGDLDVARSFLRLVQHEPIELFARRAVAGTSKRQAQRLVKHLRALPEGSDNPYARMVLTELLDDTSDVSTAAIEMERILRTGLTPVDLDRIAANGVRRTQPLSVTDIPHHLMTPTGRARGQFKATLLKEFRFTRDTVVKDGKLFMDTGGKQGSIRGLISWFVTGQAIGFTIVELKRALGFGFGKIAEPFTGIRPRRRKRPDTALAFLFDNMLQVGGFAYPLDFITSMTIDPRAGILGWVIGPGFSKLAVTIGRGATQGPAGAAEQLVPVDLTQKQARDIQSQGETLLEGLGIGEQ